MHIDYNRPVPYFSDLNKLIRKTYVMPEVAPLNDDDDDTRIKISNVRLDMYSK